MGFADALTARTASALVVMANCFNIIQHWFSQDQPFSNPMIEISILP